MPTEKLCYNCLKPNRSYRSFDPVSLALAIIGLLAIPSVPLNLILVVFEIFVGVSFFFTTLVDLVTLLFCVFAVVFAVNKGKTRNTKAALIIGIIGTVIHGLLFILSLIWWGM